MRLFIEYKSQFLDLSECIDSNMQEDERLDKVLDSGTINIITDKIPTEIPPFSRLVFKTEDGFFLRTTEYWYCNSKCKHIITNPGWYYHEIQLIEPTKILEAFIVGSKTFSIIEGKDNYNTTVDRINILCELMNQKYNVDIVNTIDDLTQEREYSFGAGSTMFDCLYEMMSTEGCIPRIRAFGENIGTYKLYLTYDRPSASDEVVELTEITSIESNQLLDDYCSEIETEMSEVVDRDTIQTAIVSCRSKEALISKDTACLTLPSAIEDVKKLNIIMKPSASAIGPIIFLCNDFVTANLETMTDAQTGMGGPMVFSNIKAGLSSRGESNFDLALSMIPGTWTKAVFLKIDLGYIFILCNSISNSYESNLDISKYLLPYEKWLLLSATEQPKYLYYKSGSNYIEGFYNTYNDGFWQSIIYGTVDPFLTNFLKNNYFNNQIDTFFNSESLKGTKNENGEWNVAWDSETYRINSKFMPIENYDDFTDYMYKVEYVSKSPVYVKEEKSINVDNEFFTKATARSYNNGANTVDYNQLVPAMKRSVDMLGLPITTIGSFDDLKVGTKTQFGYIISKQSIYRYDKSQDKIIVNSRYYNCSPNYEQVAAAIGVQTQYEATNLPQTGIISRFVYNLVNVYSSDNALLGDEPIYLCLKANSSTLIKACQKLKIGNKVSLVCEAEDNFSLDSQKAKGSGAYYLNKPISYCDSNNYQESYEASLVKFKGSTIDDFNRLPITYPSQLTTIQDVFKYKKIYKDPRERLIFVIEVKEVV